ncbi:cyclic AMP-dependent transcription factor ATF-3-like [Argopecten irradians]|uniref:cyclic AMP-dependent transcription factor ATF-3-like n=1 Tax=Argopecten irradians TaxID=31199 RepID=UPI003714F74A
MMNVDSVGEDLARAIQACQNTDSLLPMIKEELKYTIQNRRLLQGKAELAVHFTAPTKQQLRPEEIKKKENRREQNRRAARKFRQKQAKQALDFQQRIKQLEKENAELRRELKELNQEKRYIQGQLHAHYTVCRHSVKDIPGMDLYRS